MRANNHSSLPFKSQRNNTTIRVAAEKNRRSRPVAGCATMISRHGFVLRWIGPLVLISTRVETFHFSPILPAAATITKLKQKQGGQREFSQCGGNGLSMIIPSSNKDADKDAGDSNNNINNNDGGDDRDDLTKEELGIRFAEVRDYYRKTNEMAQENVCLSMLRTRLQNLRLNRCLVGPSTIPGAGNGLFAGRDILDGELITLYPGDCLLLWNKTVGDLSEDVGVMFGSHVKGLDRDPSRVTTDEARSYELEVRIGRSIVADPLLADDPAYLGHFINDGSTLFDWKNSSRTVYSRESYNLHNAAFFVMEGCHYATIATKNIPKGQEIFVSYGEGYWLSRSHGKRAEQVEAVGEVPGNGKVDLPMRAQVQVPVAAGGDEVNRGKGTKKKRKPAERGKGIPVGRGFG
jgi:hypothetical protein